jgi:hypothetical protein
MEAPVMHAVEIVIVKILAQGDIFASGAQGGISIGTNLSRQYRSSRNSLCHFVHKMRCGRDDPTRQRSFDDRSAQKCVPEDAQQRHLKVEGVSPISSRKIVPR